jgi:hypothetical protein
MGAYEHDPSAPRPFVRGDVNADGSMDLADSVFTLLHLFVGGRAPSCAKAADLTDDGTLDMTDPVYALSYLFLGGDHPPPPAEECGLDPTADGLSCERHAPCE